jgi:hypothetical protein
LNSDSLEHSITGGMYTAEDAELFVQAAAELASVTEFYNRSGSTYEEDYGHDNENDNHDTVQQQNDRVLIQWQNVREENDPKSQGKPKSDFC